MSSFYAPLWGFSTEPFLEEIPMPLPKEHAFMAACPDEHKAELTECMAAQPQVVKGPILDLLAELRTSKVPLSQILALFPLITAAFASPLTGMVPLALAIAALVKEFNPAPAPVPA